MRAIGKAAACLTPAPILDCQRDEPHKTHGESAACELHKLQGGLRVSDHGRYEQNQRGEGRKDKRDDRAALVLHVWHLR